MKKCLLLLPFLLVTFFSFSQTTNPKKDSVSVGENSSPQFPGGEDSLKAYLHRNIEYFLEFRLINFSGMVYMSYTVTKEGKLINPKIVQTCGYYKIDKEVLRVFNSMPQWTPGKEGGKPVDVFDYYRVEVYPE